MGRKRKNPDAAVGRIIRPQALPSRTVSVHKTATGRLGQSTAFVQSPPSPPHTSTSTDAAFNNHGLEPGAVDWSTSEAEDFGDDEVSQDPSSAQNEFTPMLDWVANYREAYLDEMIRHDGWQPNDICQQCGSDGLYKCKDCLGFRLLCRDCFIGTHTHLPLHRGLVSHLQCICRNLLSNFKLFFSTGTGSFSTTSH